MPKSKLLPNRTEEKNISKLTGENVIVWGKKTQQQQTPQKPTLKDYI